MAAPPEVAAAAAARYSELVLIGRAVASVAAASWAQVQAADIAGSWLQLLGRPLVTLAAGQTLAARGADDYVTRALDGQGAAPRPGGSVAPEAFAGVASDGRPLATLLQQPVVRTLTAIKAGAPVQRALTLGALDLDMIVRTQVADAGRVATGVAIAARPRTGYVRMLNPPSCSRCAILAGRWYQWNAGFDRHPRCDCLHIPAREDRADDLRTDPEAYFRSLGRADQERVFTKAGAEAVRAGADVGQVVNARRGIYTAGGRAFTSAGSGSAKARLMPEQIFRDAEDRDDAVRLLRLHGYLR